MHPGNAPNPRQTRRTPRYPRCIGVALVALATTACDKPAAEAPPPEPAGVEAPGSFEPAPTTSHAPPPQPTAGKRGEGEAVTLGVAPMPFDAGPK
jgi:hypothetical protein